MTCCVRAQLCRNYVGFNFRLSRITIRVQTVSEIKTRSKSCLILSGVLRVGLCRTVRVMSSVDVNFGQTHRAHLQYTDNYYAHNALL